MTTVEHKTIKLATFDSIGEGNYSRHLTTWDGVTDLRVEFPKPGESFSGVNHDQPVTYVITDRYAFALKST